jgi:hypothetical protein
MMTVKSNLPPLSEDDLLLLSDALITERQRVSRVEGTQSPKLAGLDRLHLLVCDRLVECDAVAQLAE